MAFQITGVLLVLMVMQKTTAGQQTGTLRLWRNGQTSATFTSGRVHIYIGGQWGDICNDNSFTITAANVICHQLGYTGAQSFSDEEDDSFGEDSVSTMVDDLSCPSSNFLVALQCSFSTNIGFACSSGFHDDASVICYTNRLWDNPYKLQVRLSQGTYTSQGLVEVYKNGQWGTVCDDGFGQIDADTVCKQLGYTGAAAYNNLPYDGSSSQTIWLSNLQCLSSTSCLRFCQMCPSTVATCAHSMDVTVECEYAGSSSVTQSTCNVNSPINECPTSTTSSSSRAGTTGTTDATSTGRSTVTSTPTSTTTVPPSFESISVVVIGSAAGGVAVILTVTIAILICACMFCYKRRNTTSTHFQHTAPNLADRVPPAPQPYPAKPPSYYSVATTATNEYEVQDPSNEYSTIIYAKPSASEKQ